MIKKFKIYETYKKDPQVGDYVITIYGEIGEIVNGDEFGYFGIDNVNVNSYLVKKVLTYGELVLNLDWIKHVGTWDEMLAQLRLNKEVNKYNI